ncbi:FMN-dependent NADH-azoreductase [Lysinibacillus sp. BF-4]|uniref:FMN dependent NADH:quinone oxidoreductase n=1 Tax=Metalysinibacillus saudimassiliensis TaxID=1461583 RepID=A0A078MEB9_9BACL|nr:FMN-dependent NADH-azoreductase [Lysinibacillus sp. BF-4]KFL43619.1 FMN-dependent NADH-azoreductase [Lysinibacillus sp. BF-4]CEA03086.1 FMN-dependent NADH-azoreductase 1 [Metalysinibacillus saudimassiliensis]
MNVLVVKANNRPSSQAISSKMYETFMENIDVDNVTVYDVFEEYTPYFGQDFFAIFGKLQQGEALTEQEQAMLAAQQKVQDLFTKADVIVYAFPLWNLTIPAKLQTFMDYVFQAGFTFKYNEQGQMVALQPNKKVILLNARGGVYSHPEAAPLEMAVNYMRNVVTGIFGQEIMAEVIIEGHNAAPQQAEQIIADGLARVAQVAKEVKNVSINA